MLDDGDADVLVAQTYIPAAGSLKNAMYGSDVVIARVQRARLARGLPAAAVVTVPFLSFRAYFPDLVLDPRNALTVRLPDRPYGAFPSSWRFLTDEGRADPMAAHAVSAHEVRSGLAVALRCCDERDAECSVRVAAPMIHAEYAKRRLFHSTNHPCDALLMRVAEGVLEHLDRGPLVGLLELRHHPHMGELLLDYTR